MKTTPERSVEEIEDTLAKLCVTGITAETIVHVHNEVLTAERQKREECKHKIEVLDNGAVLTVDNTHRFYGFKRMTKPLMYEYELTLTHPNNPLEEIANDWKEQAKDLSETHEVERTQPNNPN